MGLLQIDRKLASILAPLTGNSDAFEALFEYASFKIKHLNEQFHHVNPTDSAEIGRIQGQYIELKALMSLRDDVRAVVKGSN